MYNPWQVSVETNYEYAHNNILTIASNMEETSDVLINNFLSFSAYFSSMEWTYGEMRNIARQLEETGKYFAKLQGFSDGPSTKINYTGEEYVLADGTHFNTGDLVNHIKAEADGRYVSFYNDATNERGQPYAGHMEYGFHDRGGNFIQARPFMRPAFNAVADASKGQFNSIIRNMFERAWTERGFHGVSELSFGHSPTFNMKGYSVASKLQNRFTHKRLMQVRSSEFRKNFSADRRQDRRTKSRKKINPNARTRQIRNDSRVNPRNKQGNPRHKAYVRHMRKDDWRWQNDVGYKGNKMLSDTYHQYSKPVSNPITPKAFYRLYTKPIGPAQPQTNQYYGNIGPKPYPLKDTYLQTKYNKETGKYMGQIGPKPSQQFRKSQIYNSATVKRLSPYKKSKVIKRYSK